MFDAIDAIDRLMAELKWQRAKLMASPGRRRGSKKFIALIKDERNRLARHQSSIAAAIQSMDNIISSYEKN